jgi:hypothetical protein
MERELFDELVWLDRQASSVYHECRNRHEWAAAAYVQAARAQVQHAIRRHAHEFVSADQELQLGLAAENMGRAHDKPPAA